MQKFLSAGLANMVGVVTSANAATRSVLTYSCSLNDLTLFDTDHLKYPTLMSFSDIHEHRTMKKHEMNRKIQNIFMDMMVDLFRCCLLLKFS